MPREEVFTAKRALSFQTPGRSMRKKHNYIFLLASGIAAIFVFINSPRSINAQCGSSASSCRSCHEVQKMAPVSTKGAWHSAHAFGDFCAFCHSGSTKSKEKAAAHVGMVAPLSDVKGACQSCHPSDFMGRAKKYAAVLGKPIGTGTPAANPPITGSGEKPNNVRFGPVPPMGGTIIDLNRVYAGLDRPRPNVIGNAIMIAMILMVALVFAALVFYYEKPVPRFVAAFRRLLAMPVPQPESGAVRPAMVSLIPLLESSDPETLRAVTQLLSDRENGPRILKALTNLDLRALSLFGQIDEKALVSLLKLVREMKS
jgi:hypothetical protein